MSRSRHCRKPTAKSKIALCYSSKDMPPHGDWLVCGISTQLQHYVAGFDEVIKQSDPDFTDSGIKSASLIRLGFLAVLPMRQLIGRIGAINDARIQRMLRNLSQHLLR